jgi:hypothetical protein
MPAGYTFRLDPNEVAKVVLSKSTWAVLGLRCLIELFTLAHYKQSIEPDARLSALFNDVFRFTGWRRANTRCSTSWSGSRRTLACRATSGTGE